MDRWLLEMINQRWIHPTVDVVMILLTTVGFAALPLLAIGLIWRGQSQTKREVGWAILLALGLSAVVTLLFYYLALRPRPAILWPDEIRLLLPTPPFPSFPSGHAAAAFATAIVVIMATRRWWRGGLAFVGALLISYSRVYLGHHYPSDLFAGAVFGLAMGAAAYGLVVVKGPLYQRIRWLLWPQIAFVIVMTQMAYLDILPQGLLQWPYADKVIHALFFGAVVFWLNLWWQGRTVTMGRQALPLAVVVPFSLALLEEGYQIYSPLRTGDIVDLMADLVGMVGFWWLSRWFLRTNGCARQR